MSDIDGSMDKAKSGLEEARARAKAAIEAEEKKNALRVQPGQAQNELERRISSAVLEKNGRN